MIGIINRLVVGDVFVDETAEKTGETDSTKAVDSGRVTGRGSTYGNREHEIAPISCSS